MVELPSTGEMALWALRRFGAGLNVVWFPHKDANPVAADLCSFGSTGSA
jgi:hypothetical protein